MSQITKQGIEGGQITFDPMKYEKLKIMTRKAEAMKLKEFMFEGHLLLTKYANHLLENLKSHFE